MGPCICGPTYFAYPCYIVSTPLGLQSSEIRRRFAVHVVQTFRENVSFSPSGVQLSMKIGIDIPEDRKPRLHRCGVFKFGRMCCVPVWLLAPIYSTIAPCVDPMLSESATLFLVYGTSWLSCLHNLTWWINCLIRTSSPPSPPPPPPLHLRWHYSPIRTFPSSIDFSQSVLFFDLSFQFVILQLLISVCTQLHHLFLVFLLVDFPEDCC